MVDVLSMVVPFLAGVLVGVVGLSQYDAHKAAKAAKSKPNKRKEGAAKAAATRKKKAAEKFESTKEPAPTPGTDANLYGRKEGELLNGNGESSWPV